MSGGNINFPIMGLCGKELTVKVSPGTYSDLIAEHSHEVGIFPIRSWRLYYRRRLAEYRKSKREGADHQEGPIQGGRVSLPSFPGCERYKDLDRRREGVEAGFVIVAAPQHGERCLEFG